MPVLGDLADIGAASLVQFACREGRTAALYLSRNGTNGALYFERGQVAHAELDQAEGEQAALALIGWQTGTFRFESDVAAPAHTVLVPWRRLLREGAHYKDEDLDSPSSEPDSLSSTETKQDTDRGNELIQLMSELEYARAQIEAESTAGGASFVLATLARMLEQAQSVHDERSDETRASLDLDQAFAAATAKFPSLSNAIQPDGGAFTEQLEAFQEAVDGTALDHPGVYHQIGIGTTELLSAYLLNLSSRFHSGSLRDQWRAMCDAFITELVASFVEAHVEARDRAM